MHVARFVKTVVRSRAVLALLGLAAAATSAPLSAAEMQYPLGVAATGDGTVYVADRNLPGIWKVTDGQAEIFFQGSKKFRTPLNAVYCLAIDHEGRLLAGDSATREVYRFNEEGEPQPLTDGHVGIPVDLAVDKEGNIFATDLEVQRIWKIPPEGGQPEEFQVMHARGMAFDDQGRLWVVSHGENQVVRLSPDGKKVEVVVEGRPFQFPHQIVPNADGTVLISDGYADAIWKIDGDGNAEKWISGKPLQNPVGIARQGERLLVADPHARAIFSVDPAGKLTTLVSAGGDE